MNNIVYLVHLALANSNNLTLETSASTHLCILILLEDNTNWLNTVEASLPIILLRTNSHCKCIHMSKVPRNHGQTTNMHNWQFKQIMSYYTSSSATLCSFCSICCCISFTSCWRAFFLLAKTSLSLCKYMLRDTCTKVITYTRLYMYRVRHIQLANCEQSWTKGVM